MLIVRTRNWNPLILIFYAMLLFFVYRYNIEVVLKMVSKYTEQSYAVKFCMRLHKCETHIWEIKMVHGDKLNNLPYLLWHYDNEMHQISIYKMVQLCSWKQERSKQNQEVALFDVKGIVLLCTRKLFSEVLSSLLLLEWTVVLLWTAQEKHDKMSHDRSQSTDSWELFLR